MTAGETQIHRRVTNGITLSVAESGPVDGPLAILLHGFPETSDGWRCQVGPLAESGYRVLAPNQRGYAQSDKPEGVAAYALDHLVADVVGLIDGAGRDRATVIGHDWGGVVAWQAITDHPKRFDRAVVLNAPHPLAIFQAIRSDPSQRLQSWYTQAFRIPWLPEAILRSRDFAPLVRSIRRSSRPGTFRPEDFDRWKSAWAEPGALRSMLHWYRAGFRFAPRADPDLWIRTPVLMIWGVTDRFLGPGVARSSFALCQSARLEWIEDATHWVHHEESDRVNRLIHDFLAEG